MREQKLKNKKFSKIRIIDLKIATIQGGGGEQAAVVDIS